MFHVRAQQVEQVRSAGKIFYPEAVREVNAKRTAREEEGRKIPGGLVDFGGVVVPAGFLMVDHKACLAFLAEVL